MFTNGVADVPPFARMVFGPLFRTVGWALPSVLTPMMPAWQKIGSDAEMKTVTGKMSRNLQILGFMWICDRCMEW